MEIVSLPVEKILLGKFKMRKIIWVMEYLHNINCILIIESIIIATIIILIPL